MVAVRGAGIHGARRLLRRLAHLVRRVLANLARDFGTLPELWAFVEWRGKHVND